MSGRLPALDLLLDVLQHLALNLPQPNGANVISKNPPMPPASCHDVLTVTDEPGPAGATVQLITIVELASFSITVCPATSTFILTSRTHDLVDCSFHIATYDRPLKRPMRVALTDT